LSAERKYTGFFILFLPAQEGERLQFDPYQCSTVDFLFNLRVEDEKGGTLRTVAGASRALHFVETSCVYTKNCVEDSCCTD